MWTARVLETLFLAVVFALLPELGRARAGAVFEPHPGWIAVLVLAARYGGGGLFAGLIAAAGAAALGSALAGADLVAAWSRLRPGPDLIALGTSLVVAWVASWHLRIQARLSERVSALSERSAADEMTIEALHGVVATLRERVDRVSTSLSFIRDVAARLESTDPVVAAEATADLAIARTGASAVAVKTGVGGFQRLLAIRDARGPEGLRPLGLKPAGLTVPIVRDNARVGVIELWGLARSGVDHATAHDLGVIASWCAHALDGSALHREPGTRRAQEVR